MQLEVNLTLLSMVLKHEGRLFQIMGPEYGLLKISLHGLVVIYGISDDDLSVGMFFFLAHAL